eukprot:5344995-Pleurochrysis_carterae.AAC.7
MVPIGGRVTYGGWSIKGDADGREMLPDMKTCASKARYPVESLDVLRSLKNLRVISLRMHD